MFLWEFIGVTIIRRVLQWHVQVAVQIVLEGGKRLCNYEIVKMIMGSVIVINGGRHNRIHIF
jgi:hypothetical protein